MASFRSLHAQYVKLARVLRHKIESGQYQRGDTLPATDVAREHGVSLRVAWNALAMLAANRYVIRPGNFTSYSITWHVGVERWCGLWARRLSFLKAIHTPSNGSSRRPGYPGYEARA